MAEFQTSFIPKQVDPAYGASHASSTNFFLLIALVIFVVTAGAAGFFLVNYHLTLRQIASYDDNIRKNRAQYDESFINEASRLATRISVATKLLQQHLAVSELFLLLEKNTSIEVSLETLEYVRDPDGTLRMNATGVATGYPVIVAQSDAYGDTTYIRDLIFTGLNRNADDLVEFELSAKIDPLLLSFERAISQRAAPAPMRIDSAVGTSSASRTDIEFSTVPVDSPEAEEDKVLNAEELDALNANAANQ
jgi:hypothetical protein